MVFRRECGTEDARTHQLKGEVEVDGAGVVNGLQLQGREPLGDAIASDVDIASGNTFALMQHGGWEGGSHMQRNEAGERQRSRRTTERDRGTER